MPRNGFVLCYLVGISVIFNTNAICQSLTSGDVTGAITDPSGASIANAAVTLVNVDTTVTAKTVTNGQGTYRFAFVAPGRYTLDVKAPGFQAAKQTGIVVTAGQPTTANLRLSIATASQTVEVSESKQAVETENADVSTTYGVDTIVNLPNPGGDLTYIAQTAPGIVMNSQSGYGNFSSNGLPGTSNQFTVNGTNFTDPFLSLNNSGASNLMLGSNDLAEANVISNILRAIRAICRSAGGLCDEIRKQ